MILSVLQLPKTFTCDKINQILEIPIAKKN